MSPRVAKPQNDQPDVADEVLYDDAPDESAAAEALQEFEARQAKVQRVAAGEPMLTALLRQEIETQHQPNTVLPDFIDHVLTPLSDKLGMASAKGGDFARKKQKEYEENPTRKMRDPEHYYRDQTMRAHLLNGMLPALRIARQLQAWGAERLRKRIWSEETERLFIAGYMLHDYTKLRETKTELKSKGFEEWMQPSEDMIPALEQIFLNWCKSFGLDMFLKPIGGVRQYLHDLIYIAHNTQRHSQTIGLPSLLPNKYADVDSYERAAEVCRLADLIAYTAPTPREVTQADGNIQPLVERLGLQNDNRTFIARLTYHHVAENRGVLLNFIHEAARKALSNEQRIPILYAPSGIVYLEWHDAPPPPSPDALIAQMVTDIRSQAGQRLIDTGKGARRGNVNLQIDDSYNDYFAVPTIIRNSPNIVQKHIRSNKSADRLAPVTANAWAGIVHLPPIPAGKMDTRLDQIAEWAGFLEVQLRERLGNSELDLAGWLLPPLGLGDLLDEFRALESDPGARRAGGIKYWWFWAAAHVLDRRALDPTQVLELMETLSNALADALPADLPASARVDETKWVDLADYLARVLTIGGEKSGAWALRDEQTRYVNAKKPRGGGSACAMCGDIYAVSKPNETAVAFQPGVYTARVKLGSSSNARGLCSICALEQLLRQLFVLNLDSGSRVDEQRVRYLSLYPSYFFTPETLPLIQGVYGTLGDFRLSSGDLRKVLTEALVDDEAVKRFITDAKTDAPKSLTADVWTRLTPFMLHTADQPSSKRVLRYSDSVGGTFFMIGLRNFNDPTDIESWILPTFVSFVLAAALDLKVVISEGSVPIITEAGELPETLWFDGAHPAIRAVLDIGRTQSTDRLHVDEILPALTRLTIAYLIHLDTEFNGREEHWQRFPPLAHALAESPLYAFHYLVKQERDDADHKPINRERTRRYLSYALSLADAKGNQAMSTARKLVTLYRGFYRAGNFKNSNSVLRPFNVVADALLHAAVLPTFKEPDALYEVAYGELYKFMDRVSKGLADGRFPKGITGIERTAAMQAFCKMFVDELFIRDYHSDPAALRGKPINLLKNACEVIYREMQFAERAERGRNLEDTDAAEAADATETDEPAQ